MKKMMISATISAALLLGGFSAQAAMAVSANTVESCMASAQALGLGRNGVSVSTSSGECVKWVSVIYGGGTGVGAAAFSWDPATCKSVSRDSQDMYHCRS